MAQEERQRIKQFEIQALGTGAIMLLKKMVRW